MKGILQIAGVKRAIVTHCGMLGNSLNRRRILLHALTPFQWYKGLWWASIGMCGYSTCLNVFSCVQKIINGFKNICFTGTRITDSIKSLSFVNNCKSLITRMQNSIKRWKKSFFEEGAKTFIVLRNCQCLCLENYWFYLGGGGQFGKLVLFALLCSIRLQR